MSTMSCPRRCTANVFDVPRPGTSVFITSFSGGEGFRSGCSHTRGRGKVFYSALGNDERPTYHNPGCNV
jgi:trehalose utilization protein